MAVALDAVGPGSTATHSGTSPLAWTHTAGSQASAVVVLTGNANGTKSTLTGVTYGGTAMTLAASVYTNEVGGNASGFTSLWVLFGPPAGASTVSATYTGGLSDVLGCSASFTGAAGVGPAAVNSSALATSISATVPGTTPGGLVVSGAVMGGGAGTDAFTGTGGVTVDSSAWVSANYPADTIMLGHEPSPGGTAAPGFSFSSIDWWGIIALELLPVTQQVWATVQPSKTWRQNFGDVRDRLVTPWYFSQVSVSDSDASASSDGGEGTAAALPDSDSSTGADAGEVIAATLSDIEQPKGRAFTDAGEGIALAQADASSVAETGPPPPFAPASADAAAGTDADGLVRAFSETRLAVALPSLTWLDRFRPGSRKLVTPQAPTIGVPVVSDFELVTGTDSGFTFPADLDGAAGADDGQILVADEEDSSSTDVELTAWPSDEEDGGTSTLYPDSGETEFWSGPLADAPDTATGTDGPTPVVFLMADADACAAADAHLIDVYPYQPPFRWTGGQYELVLPHPADRRRVLRLWQGERPDGAAYRLYHAYATGGLGLVEDEDLAGAQEFCDVGSLAVTLSLTAALTAGVEVTRA